MAEKIIRIGSRESRLAIIQSRIIMEKIRLAEPSAELELVTMKTKGDKILDRTLDKIGGKGLFLKELDEALLRGDVDICVHSLKDVPAEENPQLPLKAFSERESPFDVLVLPKGTTEFDITKPVGCSSSRRSMQFKMIYPETEINPIRGNVLTRLEKLDRGEYGALILAEAGLKRLGLEKRISHIFTPDEMIPSAGQGIIAVQCRNGEYSELMKKINNTESELCAIAERQLAKELGGDCTSPTGCFAECKGEMIHLRAFYSENGVTAKCDIQGVKTSIYELVSELAKRLKAQCN